MDTSKLEPFQKSTIGLLSLKRKNPANEVEIEYYGRAPTFKRRSLSLRKNKLEKDSASQANYDIRFESQGSKFTLNSKGNEKENHEIDLINCSEKASQNTKNNVLELPNPDSSLNQCLQGVTNISEIPNTKKDDVLNIPDISSSLNNNDQGITNICNLKRKSAINGIFCDIHDPTCSSNHYEQCVTNISEIANINTKNTDTVSDKCGQPFVSNIENKNTRNDTDFGEQISSLNCYKQGFTGICEIANENMTKDTIFDTNDPNLGFNNCEPGVINFSGQTFDLSCLYKQEENSDSCVIVEDKLSLISVSSNNGDGNILTNCVDDTIIYDKAAFSLSVGLTDCNNVNVTTKNVNIKSMSVSHNKQNETYIDCEVVEKSQGSDIDLTPNLQQSVSVNIEIKKKHLQSTSDDQSKVLILNTNAIEKLSHVIVQPAHCKSFKRKIQGQTQIYSGNKSESVTRSLGRKRKVSVSGTHKQHSIKKYFKSTKEQLSFSFKESDHSNNDGNCESELGHHDDMSKIARADTARSDGIGRLHRRGSRGEDEHPKSAKMPYKDPTCQMRTTNSEVPQSPSPRSTSKNESASSSSPIRRTNDLLHFNLPMRTKSNKTSIAPKDIPYYKIVDGTHFAVDAFCYGDIPGVKNYFLTHFHTDHYSGLKKNFNKTLFCSKITADLCTTRLGVNPKYICIINVDESVRVDGVEVTAIDANHCPGALMLLFALPNGKTLLHTGDFRATPAMESHPAFWNNDIHTIYLDTTYCNPRYDFPTQDQSLEMALHILRQKKLALEKVGKKFSSVLIVCGTYTIGKEKFFLGMARRVGCAVWACPEKDRVLQTVEGRSFGRAAPAACQLHVVPMRDLTHEKLRSYLDSVQGPFSEVVAFKPSGWEHGKNTPSVKDVVTIHGIPYSEHSSFVELKRFVNFLKPKQVVPTVNISGGIRSVQKHFPCPLVNKEDVQSQSRITDFFNSQNRQQLTVVS